MSDEMAKVQRFSRTEKAIRAMDATDIVEMVHAMEDERDALRAALDAAEKRAGYLYDGLRATVEAGGGIAQPGVSDEFLVTCTPMEMRAVRRSRDAALAARDAAWRAGRDAAARLALNLQERDPAIRAALDAFAVATSTLQPPADLAAEAPGDAVAKEMLVALEAAQRFIASEYRDPSVEADGEWLEARARPVHTMICDAIGSALEAGA